MSKKKKHPLRVGRGLRRHVRGGKIFATIGNIEYSTNTKDPKEATAWRSNKINELDKTGSIRRRNTATVKQLCESYIKTLKAKGIKRLSMYERKVQRVYEHRVFKDRLASSITSDDGITFKEQRMAEGVTAGTADNGLAVLRAAFKDAVNTKLMIDFVPPAFVFAKTHAIRKGFLKYGLQDPVCKHFPASLQPYFLIDYITGMREMELLLLEWDRVDFDEKWLVLRPEDTKTGQGRKVPFLGDMQNILLRQKLIHDKECPDYPYVFFWYQCDWDERIPVMRDGRHGRISNMLVFPKTHVRSGMKRTSGIKMSLNDLHGCWRAAVDRAGYPELLVHDMRRSACRGKVIMSSFSKVEMSY